MDVIQYMLCRTMLMSWNSNQTDQHCKFCASAHSLEIERGRYFQVHQQNRICLSCNMGEFEDEEHFFLNCSSYTPARDNYIKKLKAIYSNWNSRSLSRRLLSTLLNTDSYAVLKTTVNFIDECLLKRKKLFNSFFTMNMNMYIVLTSYKPLSLPWPNSVP